MTSIFWQPISQEMHQVLNSFSMSEIGSRFYLAGGTALALQLGHRQSFDLDFFSPTEDIPVIRGRLEKSLQPFSPILADSSWGNLVFLALGVRVGYYGYGYPMVGEFVQAEEARLASIADIGLMKLDALLGRASRKDFIDLYFICQHIPLRKLLDLAPQKYPSIRDFESQAVRRLVYFDRAEQEEEIPLLQPIITWVEAKQYFRDQAKTLGRGWFDH